MMMNTANQQTDNLDKKITDQTPCSNSINNNNGETCKKTSLPMLHLMKPSLSMTSLPPQSPKEPISNDVVNDRPYNSLKKKRELNDQRELWRRSWESQNSVSTTTSQAGASTGRNEFWATYNYLMDNSIIDSCRETSDETKFASDVTQEMNFKTVNLSNAQRSSGSQGSNIGDPRRLRRWLRDMENCISKLPSLKEAMKLNAGELTKFSSESSDLYREINSNSRFVAACIRSLEKENLSSRTDDQPKSLDYSEYDSLVSTVTATSTESKRSENALKPNALERRYHLLYLRAFEIQCMFEGLLEKRKFMKLNKEFEKKATDTSDEEPVAKIPKFSSKFSSYKKEVDVHNKLSSVCDADYENNSEAKKEMECIGLKGDCIDHSIIVPVNKSSLDKEISPKVVTPKRQKDFSKFNRSNRKSKNCAIFYYKHIDTDNDQTKTREEKDGSEFVSISPSSSSSSSEEEEIWEYEKHEGSNGDSKALITNMILNETIENNVDNKFNGEETTQVKESRQITDNVSNKVELITKETWRELAQEAESLVLQKINDKTTRTEYFYTEIVGMKKEMIEKNTQKDSAKLTRVQEWLKQNQIPNEEVINAHSTIQQEDNDGDVSADCSSNEEDSTSEEITDSVATCIDPLLTSTEGLENVSPTHKVAMRSKTTHRRNSDRPWSVSCVSQLTRNSRQSLTDEKILEANSTALSNFSISESALNHVPNKSENSGATRVSSKNSSLRRRRVKSRKKSLSSNKRSDSGSSVKDYQVSDLLKSITNSTGFLEDLSAAISMMNLGKDTNSHGAQKINSDEEEEDDNHTMKKPEFKIGSLTNVYGSPMNLGSLAALANYNSVEKRRENTESNNETGPENLSSFSEHNMWDNYMGEKYNSETYSEDRDVDAARKLLDCDDYRNFIDSQSDCCSSLNSAANQQMDSLSPPRPRKNIDSISPQPQSSNENSLRQRRTQEERKNFLELLLKKANDYENDNLVAERSLDENEEESKFIADCKMVLENTQALRLASTNPQLLRPEDYDEIAKTCEKNIKQLELMITGSGCKYQNAIEGLLASWNNLLKWSENAANARRLQEEIISQKQLLDSIDVDNLSVLNSEEAIREKIIELMNSREELFKHRSNMLKLNAAVHSWLTRQELELNEHEGNQDLTNDKLHTHLKDEVVSLYAKWDFINAKLTTKLENLNDSLECWNKFEKGLEEFKENLSKDRGALNGLKGAIEEGTTTPEELVDNVQQVSKLLSEKLENRIQTISSNQDFMRHPEAALKFIASSNSYQSDSGISDEGFSELSERERRLIALKKIAKQLEGALSPSSDVLKTITQRMEAAENDLKMLQNTCRELILQFSSQLLKQQGIDISSHAAQAQINVQIPIITIKNKSKRSPPRRGKKQQRHSPVSHHKPDDLSSGNEICEPDIEEPNKSKWGFVKRIAKIAVPIQLSIITIFCVACLLEPRCCDTLNTLSMSLTPQLRYVNGNPPT